MGRGTAALIVAAGSGTRLGAGGPKALVEVAGRPLFEWSVDACRESASIGPVTVVAPAGHLEEFRREGITVVAGGSSRSESVSHGLSEVESELVVVHDAARPLAAPDLFDRAIAALIESPDLDAVIAAAVVTDTTKQVGPDGRVESTLDRERLRAVQTPQVFRTVALRRAIATGDLATATDDASLIEAAGGSVGVIDAPSGNIKVTVPADLALAELRLLRDESRNARSHTSRT
ncbi:MAG: 2-C-methyl-D-erythritol 4-phosphate cytidylyltransferase [Actinomycetota bacterium]|nr:2-C-methyl-D-erythritol 4-phosphate cytidylyltransferase [Actinomycetota bacterium]